MPTGCSLNLMMKKMPERTFDVGIAEQHAVTFAAGLAADGMIPFCNIYSSFMQRAYDQVIHDVALQKLPVVFCLDRAGIVGEDGATHHGAFDLAYFRPIPNLTIASPLNERALRNLMFTAQSGQYGAFVIRYPRPAKARRCAKAAVSRSSASATSGTRPSPPRAATCGKSAPTGTMRRKGPACST